MKTILPKKNYFARGKIRKSHHILYIYMFQNPPLLEALSRTSDSYDFWLKNLSFSLWYKIRLITSALWRLALFPNEGAHRVRLRLPTARP